MSFGTVWVIAVLLGAPAFEGFKESSCPTGPILWRGLSGEEVAWAAQELPRAAARVAEKLGWACEAPFTAVLVPDRSEMRRFLERFDAASSSTRGALGVAIPSLRILVVRWDHVYPSESLAETLCHEVAHITLHPTDSSAIPRWLDEGAAQWASGRRLTPDQLSYLAFLSRIGGLYPLESMERVFPTPHELSSLAYQQSLLWVEFVSERWGDRVLQKLLHEASRGSRLDVLLPKLTGADSKRIEREFQSWVAAQTSLGAALVSVISLWSVAALLALAAILRYAVRRRRRLRDMEGEPSGDSDGPGEGA